MAQFSFAWLSHPGLLKLKHLGLVGLGYMLSPLSWWNDLFFNFPIAAAFGYGVNWLHPGWFVPATAVGYWVSNVLGILMMQFGATDLLFPERDKSLKRDLLWGIGGSTVYTLGVVALIYAKVLTLPEFLAP